MLFRSPFFATSINEPTIVVLDIEPGTPLLGGTSCGDGFTVMIPRGTSIDAVVGFTQCGILLLTLNINTNPVLHTMLFSMTPLLICRSGGILSEDLPVDAYTYIDCKGIRTKPRINRITNTDAMEDVFLLKLFPPVLSQKLDAG